MIQGNAYKSNKNLSKVCLAREECIRRNRHVIRGGQAEDWLHKPLKHDKMKQSL